MVIAAIAANLIRAILDDSLVLRTMDHALELLIGFGNQLRILFYGRGLWISGLWFAARGLLMGWPRRRTVV